MKNKLSGFLLGLLFTMAYGLDANAAKLVHEDPMGGFFIQSLNGEFYQSGTSLGPDFVKYESPIGNGIAGYELGVEDGAATIGGWGLASGLRADFKVNLRVRIVGEGSEQPGDPITVFLHSKAYIEGPGNFSGFVRHTLNLPGGPNWSHVYSVEDGWYRDDAIPFDVRIDDVLTIVTEGVSGVFTGGDTISDSRFQLSLTPHPPPDPPVASMPCSDGVDNDGDGATDFPDDLGCRGPADPSEEFDCEDGLDNDADGRIDFDPLTFSDPLLGNGDPGCGSAAAAFEDSQCQDGFDNDGQIGTDFDGGASAGAIPDPNGADPNCASFWDNREAANGGTACGLGLEVALLLPLLGGWRRHRAG